MARPRKPPRLVRVKDRENWYIRDGREVVSTGTPDGEEAKCFLATFLIRRDTPKSPTIVELLDMRLANLRAAGKARAANTPSYHKTLKDHFGALRPSQITQAHLNRYWEKREAAPASLREELLELKTTLRMAVREGYIDKAPYIEVPARRPPRETFLTQLQARALLDAARPIHLRLYLLIAMTTGARRGAILGLTWDRVDLQRGRIDFTDPALVETRKRRTVVPIAKETVAALRTAREASETDHVIEYMGSSVKSIKRAFSEAAARAGVPWATPHVLKHSVISWLAEGRISVDRIADMTATHPNTVRRIYRKFSPDYLEDVADLLGKSVGLANPFAKRGG